MTSNAQTGYECFDELIRQLRVEGHVQPAARLHELLHETAWTTTSELMGELGLAILAFKRSGPSVSSDLRRLLDSCMRLVRRVWPGIKYR
jgi:hypothetical protein